MRRSIATIALAVLALSACRLETATGPKGDASFQTRFADAQELSVGHTVRISDVVVGTVTGIELDGYEAVVEYSIVDGREIPDGTVAAIGSTSLLGENYVQLRLPEPVPERNLEPESVIPSAGTVATVEELAIQLLAVTRAIQGRDVAGIVEAGATALGARGEDLNALLVSLGDLTGGLAAQSGVIDRLLADAESLVASLAPAADAVGDTLGSAAEASAVLAAQRERMVDAVEDLTVLAATLDSEVLDPHRARLERIVADLGVVTGALVEERDRLGDVLTRVVVATERIPSAVHEETVLAYAWMHELSYGDRQIILDGREDVARRSLSDIVLPGEARSP